MTNKPTIEQAALALLESDLDERRKLLDEYAQTDPRLARRLAAFLEHNSDSDDIGISVIWKPAVRTTDKDAHLSETTLAGYRLKETLGKGAMGTVFRATHLLLEQERAVKIVRDGFGVHFDEPRLLAKVPHEHIAHVYDAGLAETATGTFSYIAMELVPEAKSITEFSASRKLSKKEKARLMLDACEGVAAAHRVGILHRDLKPQNILVGSNGVLKIVDFGLAIADGQSVGASRVAGTLAYMAPERVLGMPATVATDVYALGLVMRQLFLNRSGVDESTMSLDDLRLPRIADRSTSVKQRTTPSLVHCDLDYIVNKATADREENRYDSVGTLIGDLKRYLRGEPLPHRPFAWITWSVKTAARRHWKPLLPAAVVMVIALGLFWRSEQFHEFTEEGKQYHKDKKLESAIRSFENALKIRREDPKALQRLAVSNKDLYNSLSESERGQSDAMRILQKAHNYAVRSTEYGPEYAQTWNILGIISKKLGRYVEAEHAFVRGIKAVNDDETIKPENKLSSAWFALLNRGRLRIAHLNKIEDGGDDLLQAGVAAEQDETNRDPELMAGSWRARASWFLAQGDSRCVADIFKAIDTTPENRVDGWNMLIKSRVELAAWDFDAARRSADFADYVLDVQNAGTLSIIKARAKRVLALAYLNVGENKEAISNAQLAIVLGDLVGINQLVISIASARLGDEEAAWEAFEAFDFNEMDELFEERPFHATEEDGFLWFEISREWDDYLALAEEELSALPGSNQTPEIQTPAEE
jgi:serine/threonine protein kinase